MYDSLIRGHDPKALAIEGPGIRMSYGQLDQATAKSVDPSPFVARQEITTIVHLLALWRQGQVACLLSHRLPPKALEEASQRMRGAKGFATLQVTSGTTGRAKIAAHSFENHLSSARAMVEQLQLGPGSRYLLNLPLFPVAGMAPLIGTFLAGATLVLEGSTGITHLSAVPTQLHTMKPFPDLKTLLLGGAPLMDTLPEKTLGSYGMTEMSSTIAVGTKWLTPLPHVEVKIDKKGQIWVRGPSLFQGYFEKGELLLPQEEGWFATGDLGSWRADGAFEWVGRSDRQFITGGENIQPEEIEKALTALPGVVSAKVEPRVDNLYGKRPVASIETSRDVTEAEIKELLEEILPRFKIPDQIFISQL
ncbi:MAG: 2-succinylbenzoate--CoA ligase [Chlamydiae bacterium]|nr:2-succinylbenzoate--CoA ligase [Chlamydiota bacterium]